MGIIKGLFKYILLPAAVISISYHAGLKDGKAENKYHITDQQGKLYIKNPNSQQQYYLNFKAERLEKVDTTLDGIVKHLR